MNEEPVGNDDVVDVIYRDWLNARRSESQTTSFRLHSLIRTHAKRISDSENLIVTTRGLVRAASFLWRATCLSNRLAASDDFEEDDFFLTDQIIQEEFIAGRSARSAPDWLFFSHMSNARDALLTIAAAPELSLLSQADMPAWTGLSYRQCWIRHQRLLDRAVERFQIALSQ